MSYARGEEVLKDEIVDYMLSTRLRALGVFKGLLTTIAVRWEISGSGM